MKDDPFTIISQLHNVYTYCGLVDDGKELKNELSEIMFQIAAGLFETVYIRLIGIELDMINFLESSPVPRIELIGSFYIGLTLIEIIVDG